MDFLHRIAEQKIKAAIERGELDDLPLSGKPLPPDAGGGVAEDLRLAYKLLKDAGFVPPEIELRKEIVTFKELLRTVTDEDEVERYRLVREINDHVLRLNLRMRRSFDRDDQQLYAGKVREKLER